jgi:hypothetical protein
MVLLNFAEMARCAVPVKVCGIVKQKTSVELPVFPISNICSGCINAMLHHLQLSL